MFYGIRNMQKLGSHTNTTGNAAIDRLTTFAIDRLRSAINRLSKFAIINTPCTAPEIN